MVRQGFHISYTEDKESMNLDNQCQWSLLMVASGDDFGFCIMQMIHIKNIFRLKKRIILFCVYSWLWLTLSRRMQGNKVVKLTTIISP